MAPRGKKSESRLARTLCDDSEANWNGQAEGQTSRQTGPGIESG